MSEAKSYREYLCPKPNGYARLMKSLLVLLFLPMGAMAQVVDLDKLPWSLVSETAVFDGKTSTYVYTGLQFSQGNISIESDEGRATNGSEDNRELKFSGNVVIVVDGGRIECDSADLMFDGSTLSSALVTGSPAVYTLRREGSDDETRAQAAYLSYDVQEGIIEFSGEATITESGNQIASNFLVYDINERTINADSSGAEDDRVRVTFTPDDTNDGGAGEQATDDNESP